MSASETISCDITNNKSRLFQYKTGQKTQAIPINLILTTFSQIGFYLQGKIDISKAPATGTCTVSIIE